MTRNSARRPARLAALFAALLTSACLAACAQSEAPDPVVPDEDPAIEEISSSENSEPALDPAPLSGEAADAVADLGLSIVRTIAADQPDSNVIASPLSIDYALAMTANGAKGETLAEMEGVLGLPVAELNEQLGAYRAYLDEVASAYGDLSGGGSSTDGGASGTDADSGDAYASMAGPLKLANSIWLRDGVDVQDEFLRVSDEYYRSAVFGTYFNDSTADDINRWVSEATDGMIDQIVDEVPGDAVMYLVNALAFDAQWASPYVESRVEDEPFTNASGAVETAAMMKSEEGTYLETADAVGFMKRYSGGDFAFVALLPREGLSVRDFVASLDGTSLRAAIEGAQYHPVDAWLPRFEFSSEADLSSALSKLGMPTAFDSEAADFSGIALPGDAGGNVFIGCVLHKAYISVMEEGTRAAAATAVGMGASSAAPDEDPPEPKIVHLDRPFLFAIVDTASSAPVFLGIVESVA